MAAVVSSTQALPAPLRVAITGAVGNIGYALSFMVGQGRALGAAQPVILHLVDLPGMEDKLEALHMELQDCALPLLAGVVCATELSSGFKDVDVAILVGARPRGPGMLRKDLLAANAKIFQSQGAALEAHASREVRVLVVGNPCNTNALIASTHAPSIPAGNFSAMTRLDQNRAAGAIAAKLGVSVAAISGVTIWGNHSATQVPDARFAMVAPAGAVETTGVRATVGDEWLLGDLVTATQQRGKAVIGKRGTSSAGSAANGICDHLRDWFCGSSGAPVSMVVPCAGEYGLPAGLFISLPVRCAGGWATEVDTGVAVDDWLQARLDATVAELQEERAQALGSE